MQPNAGLAHCRKREGRDADGYYGDDGLTPTMRRIEAHSTTATLYAPAQSALL